VEQYCNEGGLFIIPNLKYIMKCSIVPQPWMVTSEQPKQQYMYMRFRIWNVRILYRSVSLKTVARELMKHTLDFMEL